MSGDRLHIVSCDLEEIRVGDVLVFVSPEDGSKVVHRVITIGLHGIKTRGDNCTQADDWVLRREHIIGRVVRGTKRRKVFGGLLGRLFAGKVRLIREIDSRVSCFLRPAYDELSRAGIFIRLLPSQMMPRVIALNRAAGKELQVLMGRRVIGRWLPGMTRWQIRRPFRLFVDEDSLPENSGKASVVPPEADQLSVANKAKVSGADKAEVSGVGFQVSDVNNDR